MLKQQQHKKPKVAKKSSAAHKKPHTKKKSAHTTPQHPQQRRQFSQATPAATNDKEITPNTNPNTPTTTTPPPTDLTNPDSQLNITNPRFNTDVIIATRKTYLIDDNPQRIDEQKVEALILEHKRKKQSRMYRISEYLRDHESQARAVALAIPAAALMYATHGASMYAASFIDSYTQDPEFTTYAVMGLGAAQLAVAGWLFKSANKILSLAGQPSEAVIKDIVKLSLANPKLKQTLGEGFKLGHFATVATIPGEFRIADTKAQHYQEWLDFQAGKFTNPIPEIPFPRFLQRYLSIFPAFQTSAWNSAVAEKVALDIRTHPEDYLEQNDEVTTESEEADTTNNNNNDNDNVDPSLRQIADPTTLNKPLDADSLKAYDSDTGLAYIPPAAVVQNYSGYERWWKPRRLQFAAHLVGSEDEGLLLAEVEKLHFGAGGKHAGGLLQYKTCEFVSLKTGYKVQITQNVERPSFLNHSHIKKLFDTIPIQHVHVDKHTFDYIMVEDKTKKQMGEKLQIEKQKADVGIYH